MNKKELIDKIAESANITKKDAGVALDCVMNSIMEAVKDGDNVTLVGFGTFKQTKRAARKGRNPQTGAEINIPASAAPKFVPGKAFKELLK